MGKHLEYRTKAEIEYDEAIRNLFPQDEEVIESKEPLPAELVSSGKFTRARELWLALEKSRQEIAHGHFS